MGYTPPQKNEKARKYDFVSKFLHIFYDADDLLVIVRGRHNNITKDLMQTALNLIRSCCVRERLGVNPSKRCVFHLRRAENMNLKF